MHPSSRSPWPTYFAALLLGALLGLLLIAPARAADSFRLDRVGITRFTAVGADKLQRQNGVLHLDGRVQWKQSTEVARPAELETYLLDRPLIAKTAWSAYYQLGAFALEGFELQAGAQPFRVGEEAFYIIGVTPGGEPINGPLVNLSTRVFLPGPSEEVVAGFVIDTRSRSVLVRAVGPGLTRLGVNNAAPDTFLEIKRNGQTIHDNDDWSWNPVAAGLINQATSRVGAFPLDPGSRDAARVAVLPPGAYTLHAKIPGIGIASGTVLLEIYTLPNDFFWE